MNFKLIFNFLTIFVLFKNTNAQIPSLPPGAAIAPRVSHTVRPELLMKRQFSHLQIINLVKKNLLKNPGLPPALPPSIPTNTENNGNNPLLNNNEEKSENNKNLEDKKEEKINSGENQNKEQINEELKIGQEETTLPSLPDSIPANSEGFPPASPPSYIQCLHRIQSKICDPDNVLIQSQKNEIDEMLKELEDATRKDNLQNECDRSGLEVMVIIVKHSNLLDNTLDSVQKKLSDALNIWVQDPDHHCEKPLILMMSADPEIPNRKVWTGRHYSVPVDPAELVKLFMDQEQLLAKEKYSEVILNIIDGVLNKYEQRAFNG
uniref:Uncharacterized protein n=1 Tax=Meloidogyne enterolobii TaxID=390850 RepID=A0A6V7VC78_MELEN|nr:unnamed protein product [Meloidogyne enterolobii]